VGCLCDGLTGSTRSYHDPVGEPRWLTQDEQRSWRAWLSAVFLLGEQLEHDMKRENDLTGPEYEVLVRLSEAPKRRLRMTALANQTLFSKSRLSHQITRMEEAGLVERQQCSDDRRGAYAVLTDAGWARLVAAAPAHVESVRRHLVDVLSPAQFAELGTLCAAIVAHLTEGSETPPAD